jgi:hypothetical protein
MANFFSTVPAFIVLILGKKFGWVTFWATFLQTHPVTLT